jgi:hypothetical protein
MYIKQLLVLLCLTKGALTIFSLLIYNSHYNVSYTVLTPFPDRLTHSVSHMFIPQMIAAIVN